MPAFVQGVVKDSGSTPSASPTLGTALAVGDLIVVATGVDTAGTALVTGVTDNKGNTYTRVPSFALVNGTTITLDCFYAVVTNGGSGAVVTVAFNDSSCNCNFVVQHFNGFAGTPTLDKTQRQANASSTTATSGASAATTVASELVVGLTVHGAAVSAYSLGTGYSNLTQSSVANRQVAMESKTVSATGSQTATFSIAAARLNTAGLVTFYEAVTATAPTVTPGQGNFFMA